MAARPSKAIAAATHPPSEASSCSSSWSDLPLDLVGLVLRRFPSLADRVRFGSVCRHWHHAAQLQAPVLPPVLPLTICFYTGMVQTIPDGEVHRLRSSKFATCSGSSENWLLMTGRASGDDTERRNFLENPVSGATLPLPLISNGNRLRSGGLLNGVTKFIVCAHNLAVATIFPRYRDPLIACCRPGTSSWSTSPQGIVTTGDRPGYKDIAFNDGSIYAMTERGDLFAHEVSEEHGRIVMSSAKLVIKGGDTGCSGASRLLVVSRGGRLLMVKWNRVASYDNDGISVFEANLQMSRWSRLSSIGDQVLFVSQGCSKAVTVSPNRDDYLCGDRIYFMDDTTYGPQKCCFGPTRCGMYDLGTNTYHPVISDAFRTNDIGATSWFFPHK